MRFDPDAPPRVMDVFEVAALARRSPRTIRNRISLGLEPRPLPHRKGERLLFERVAVLRWLGLEDDGADA